METGLLSVIMTGCPGWFAMRQRHRALLFRHITKTVRAARDWGWGRDPRREPSPQPCISNRTATSASGRRGREPRLMSLGTAGLLKASISLIRSGSIIPQQVITLLFIPILLDLKSSEMLLMPIPR